MMRSTLLLTAALCLSACTVNLNTEGQTVQETRRFAVSGPPTLTLETFAGAIEIHSWDRPEIEIEIERRAMDRSLLDEMRIEATQEGDRVALTVTGPARYTGGVTVGVNISPRARLRVAMPRDATLNAYSRDGAVTAEALTGTLVFRTDDGAIRGMRLSGDIHLRTGDGSIRLEDIDGRLDMETEDGSLAIDGTFTALRARTGDGSIRATIRQGSRLDEAWEVTTGDGSVVMRLPAELDAELDASTGDGRVTSSHSGVRFEGEDRRRDQARTTIGKGGRTLTVRSGDGSVRIES